MRLVRNSFYNPFSDLMRLHNELNELLDYSFEPFVEKQTELLATNWAPAIDILESKDSVLVKADLPGINKEDLDIIVEDKTLILKGEKKFDNEFNDNGYIRTERFAGFFQRSISLPADIDNSLVKAEYTNGVLELTLPKKEASKPKQIKVDIQ